MQKFFMYRCSVWKVTIIFRDDVRALKVGSGSAIITAVEEHAVVRLVAHPSSIG